MARYQELRSYEWTSPVPGKKSVDIDLKQHNVRMTLNIPSYGVFASPVEVMLPEEPPNNRHGSLSRVLSAHTAFRVSMQPGLVANDEFYDSCTAEVNTISLLFPGIRSEAALISFAAWLAFVCAMDDILETLPPLEGEVALLECIDIMQSRVSRFSDGIAKDTIIQRLASALHDHCAQHLSLPSFFAFSQAACVVFQGHLEEIRFQHGQIPNDLATYMSIRSRTIALGPFFEVIKHEYLPTDLRSNYPWEKLELEVSRAVGLQNDLIGLKRDIENGEPLNAVIVLLRAHGNTMDNLDDTLFSKCIRSVNVDHNQSVARTLDCLAQFHHAATDAPSEAVTEVARHIVLLCETHLKWCASAKRYCIKTE